MGRIIVLRVYSSCFPSFFIIKTQKKHAWVYIYVYATRPVLYGGFVRYSPFQKPIATANIQPRYLSDIV